MENQTKTPMDATTLMRGTLHEQVDQMDAPTLASVLAMLNRIDAFQPPAKLQHLDTRSMIALTAGLYEVMNRSTADAFESLTLAQVDEDTNVHQALGAVVDTAASALLVATKIMGMGEFVAVDMSEVSDTVKAQIEARFGKNPKGEFGPEKAVEPQSAVDDLVAELQPTVDALIANQQKAKA